MPVVPATTLQHRGRRILALLATLTLAALTVTVLPTAPAQAAITTPFAKRFSANTTGDILVRGNTLMTCVTGDSGCPLARTGGGSGAANNNNGFTMQFVDIDADGSTHSSSSATLNLGGTGTVLWAGLYWSAYTGGGGGTAPPGGTAKDRLLFKAPGDGSYRTVTAGTIHDNPANDSYQSIADVTSIVRAAGSGTYTGADIFAESGTDDRYGAWALVVVVQDPTKPLRNLTVFDGFGTVQNTPSTDRTLTIPVSGFETPRYGTVRVRLGAVVYEGDRGSTGDSFSLIRADSTVVPLSDAQNPSANIFNSTVSDNAVTVAGRNPSYDNTLGFDADVYESTSLLTNGATSASLRLTTSSETFFPGVLTFATDLYAPRLIATKAVSTTDLDSDGLIGYGDRMTYTIDVENQGLDDATATVLTDAVPLGTAFQAGSMTVDGVAQTDAADSDRAELAGSALKVRLGTGAGGSSGSGGTIVVTGTTRLVYSVTVTSANPEGASIVNVANLAYGAAGSSLLLSGASSVATTAVSAPKADLGVDVTASTALVQTTGSRAVTWTATVVNGGPNPEPNPVAVLTLPAGTAGISAPGCTVVGTTVTCSLATLAPGDSAAVTVSGTLAATATNAARTIATVSGAALDPVSANNADQVDVVVNTPPVAGDDTLAVPAGGSDSVDLLANDTDADGDALDVSVAVVSPPAHGTVSLSGGVLTYTPTDPAFAGDDTVVYTVCDPRGGCDTATVTVTVANAAPVATDDSAGTPTDTPVDVDVLANDTDANGDPLTITAVTQPANGTVTIVAGKARFVPDTGWTGTTSFTYTVCDGQGGCDTGSVSVIVDNAAPVAVDDTGTTPFQTDFVVPSATLTANDDDPNSDPLTVTAVGGATHGTVSLDGGSGDVTFTPDAGFVGIGTFTYTVTDGTSTSTATVTVTVTNTAPTAGDDTATVAAGDSDPVDVLGNDADPQTPDAGLTVTLISTPAHGGASVDGSGRIVVTAPDDGFHGDYTIDYQVCDPQGACDTAQLTVTVPNRAPVADDDARSMSVDGSILIPVTANDTDPNGDDLTVDSVTAAPAHGAAVAGPSGVTYTPDTGWTGRDTFTYRVCDDQAPPLCDTADVTIDVANAVPVAAADATLTDHVAGSPTVVTFPVTDNDTDGDGDALDIVAVTQPAVGTVTISGGSLVYTVPAGSVGTQTVSYEVADGHGGASRATLTVTVANLAPATTDDTGSTGTHTPVELDVLGNDSDPDGDALTVTSFPTAPAHGAVVIGPGSSVTYTPDAAWTGTDTFVYRACDPYGSCADATATVTVSNTAPVAVDDAEGVHVGSSVDVDVRANDTDDDTGDTLADPTIVTPPASGTAVVQPDGTIRVTPAPAPWTATRSR